MKSKYFIVGMLFLFILAGFSGLVESQTPQVPAR